MTKKLSLPKLSSILMPINGMQMTPEASFEQVRLEDVDLSGHRMPGLSMDESMLEKVLFLEAKLDKVSLLDVQV